MTISFTSVAVVAAVAVTALLLVRGVPVLMTRRVVSGPSRLLAAMLLQATSLSIPVVAGQIGVEMGLMRPATYVALVTAGLISVIVFPLASLTLLRGRQPVAAAAPVSA